MRALIELERTYRDKRVLHVQNAIRQLAISTTPCNKVHPNHVPEQIDIHDLVPVVQALKRVTLFVNCGVIE
jgi:hypothetical protein